MLKFFIGGLGQRDGHSIRGTCTTTLFDKEAKAAGGIALGGKLDNLLGGTIGQLNHGNRIRVGRAGVKSRGGLSKRILDSLKEKMCQNRGMHGIQLVQDLAVILAGAAVATVICQRLKQPVVLGYILAGVVLGPNTPPFRLISNEEEIRTLAELGVILLMFSVGLHFSFRKLKEVGGWLWLRQSWRSRECFF